MKLFAETFYAQKSAFSSSFTTGFVFAEDKESAKALAYNSCKQEFPSDQGYIDWQVSVYEIRMGLAQVDEKVYELSLREVKSEGNKE